MSTKELQEKLVSTMQTWQKIEDASIASTGKIIEQTDNPLIRLVMEIIQLDSQMHYRVQDFIARVTKGETFTLTPEDMGTAWEGIEKHIAIEKKMVGLVEETLGSLKGKKMVIQEYLLNYLKQDESKHDDLLSALEKVKAGMYPYS